MVSCVHCCAMVKFITLGRSVLDFDKIEYITEATRASFVYMKDGQNHLIKISKRRLRKLAVELNERDNTHI